MHDKRWQYKVVTLKPSAFSSAEKTDTLIEEALMRLGMEGWELVNVIALGHYNRLFLKR